MQPILDAANALMRDSARQYRKALARRTAAAKRKPQFVTVQDDQAQADYVVEQSSRRASRACTAARQAVLLRSSHHSDVLELELIRRNIPYVKYGGLNFSKPRTSRTCSRCCAGPTIRRTGSPRSGCCSCCLASGRRRPIAALKVFEASGYAWPTFAQFQDADRGRVRVDGAGSSLMR